MRSKIKWKLKNLPINKTMGKSDGRNRSPRPIWRPEFKDWSCNLKIRYNENPAALTFKECVIVEFPNCISTTTNKPFQWMPRSHFRNTAFRITKELKGIFKAQISAAKKETGTVNVNIQK